MLIDITKFFTLIPLTTAWLAIESGVDIIITGVLSRALWRSRTGITRTNTIINRCIRAAIQSGLFPSVFAFLHFIVFFFWPYTYLYAIFHYPLGRIYSNSLIYSLVVRKELANIASAPATTTGSNAFPVVPRATSISIRLHRETVSDVMVVGGDTKTSLNRTTIVSPSQIEG
ncbi:hypothetical protein DL96DRAFT_1621742 [Flagelloscypha sp. PMI_526]|nr:hypothetical protein DL96DRAFT_1621742 [Flagelloscypha sp. PMI_526]